MKKIDKIIKENVNNYLLSEKVGFKRRIKNALNGFDTGYDYQKNMSQRFYAFRDAELDLREPIKSVADFVRYFNKYQGNNNQMICLKQYASAFQQRANIFYNFLKNPYVIQEGLGNRIKGFVRGLGNNHSSERGYENSDAVQNPQSALEFYQKDLESWGKSVISIAENFIEQYSNNPRLQKLLNNIQTFINLVQYINNYAEKLINVTPEEHSNFTDFCYSIPDKTRKLANKMFYDNESDNDDTPQDNEPSSLDPYLNKFGNMIKTKVKDFVGNKNYDRLKLYAEE